MVSYDTGELKTVVASMEREIQRIGAPAMRKKAEFLQFQKDQVYGIIELERRFRDTLMERGEGQRIYEGFCDYAQTLSSVMSARSFFRERQEAFVDVLGPAIEARDWRFLSTYRINYRFIAWALTLGLDETYIDLGHRIKQLRADMVVLLMPLAISRARIFRGKTPPSHLALLDQTQTSFEGLLMAVDKYVPPPDTGFSSVYRAVAICRITGELIANYSQTLLHFYPGDRKILYRANKKNGRMVKGMGGTDYEQMATELNAESEGAFVTSAAEVSDLMAASSHVSADAIPGVRRQISKMVTDAGAAPDVRAEVSEGIVAVRRAARGLKMVQRKLLALRGMLDVGEVCDVREAV